MQLRTLIALLGLLFVALKLAHQIEWAWWWVLLPFYGPWALIAFSWGLQKIADWLDPQAKKNRELINALDNYSRALRRKS